MVPLFSVFPAASFATATSCSVSVGPIVMTAGVTVTEATALAPGPVDSLLHAPHEDAANAASPMVRKRGQRVMGRRTFQRGTPDRAGSRRRNNSALQRGRS